MNVLKRRNVSEVQKVLLTQLDGIPQLIQSDDELLEALETASNALDYRESGQSSPTRSTGNASLQSAPCVVNGVGDVIRAIRTAMHQTTQVRNRTVSVHSNSFNPQPGGRMGPGVGSLIVADPLPPPTRLRRLLRISGPRSSLSGSALPHPQFSLQLDREGIAAGYEIAYPLHLDDFLLIVDILRRPGMATGTAPGSRMFGRASEVTLGQPEADEVGQWSEDRLEKLCEEFGVGKPLLDKFLHQMTIEDIEERLGGTMASLSFDAEYRQSAEKVKATISCRQFQDWLAEQRPFENTPRTSARAQERWRRAFAAATRNRRHHSDVLSAWRSTVISSLNLQERSRSMLYAEMTKGQALSDRLATVVKRRERFATSRGRDPYDRYHEDDELERLIADAAAETHRTKVASEGKINGSGETGSGSGSHPQLREPSPISSHGSPTHSPTSGSPQRLESIVIGSFGEPSDPANNLSQSPLPQEPMHTSEGIHGIKGSNLKPTLADPSGKGMLNTPLPERHLHPNLDRKKKLKAECVPEAYMKSSPKGKGAPIDAFLLDLCNTCVGSSAVTKVAKELKRMRDRRLHRPEMQRENHARSESVPAAIPSTSAASETRPAAQIPAPAPKSSLSIDVRSTSPRIPEPSRGPHPIPRERRKTLPPSSSPAIPQQTQPRSEGNSEEQDLFAHWLQDNGTATLWPEARHIMYQKPPAPKLSPRRLREERAVQRMRSESPDEVDRLVKGIPKEEKMTRPRSALLTNPLLKYPGFNGRLPLTRQRLRSAQAWN